MGRRTFDSFSIDGVIDVWQLGGGVFRRIRFSVCVFMPCVFGVLVFRVSKKRMVVSSVLFFLFESHNEKPQQRFEIIISVYCTFR